MIPQRRVLMLALLVSFQTFSYVFAQEPAQATGAPPGEHRKTSEPYTGDLSIFDSPGRDERLQINRVMDILGIAPGKAVADIGAGSGWFTVRAARRVGDVAWFTRWILTRNRFAMSATAHGTNICAM